MEQRHKAKIDAVLRRFYGPRNEKFDPTELLLFGLSVAEQAPVDSDVVEAESGEKLATRRINHQKHGRRQLPEHLPRVEIVHDLSEEQKKCPCCGEFQKMLRLWISDQQQESRSTADDIQSELSALRDQHDRLLNLRLMDEIEADTFARKIPSCATASPG